MLTRPDEARDPVHFFGLPRTATSQLFDFWFSGESPRATKLGMRYVILGVKRLLIIYEAVVAPVCVDRILGELVEIGIAIGRLSSFVVGPFIFGLELSLTPCRVVTIPCG